MPELEDAVLVLNVEKVIEELRTKQHCPGDGTQGPSLYHVLVEGLCQNSDAWKAGARIVYCLRNYGHDINYQDEVGNSPLLLYLTKCNHTHEEVVEAMLRCNADPYLDNQSGQYPLGIIKHDDSLPNDVRRVFINYIPGMWSAVELDDVMSVRKLINQWCRVDIVKESKSLIQKALDIGTENVIRVVSRIQPSMNLAHGVLAGDLGFVEDVLKTKRLININLKHLAGGGATPIYYAACLNNERLIDLLLSHGARVDIAMDLKGESEMPIFLALLKRRPQLKPEIIKQLVPQTVSYLFHKGKNVLFHCIENNIVADVVEYIISKCSAYVITQRILKNMTARDCANNTEKTYITEIIDKVVMAWCCDEVSDTNRKILALHGYSHIPSILQKYVYSPTGSAMSDGETVTDIVSGLEYFQKLPYYQNQVECFVQAIENNDLDLVQRLLFLPQDGLEGLELCLADCRRQGDGQPPLHKAVLRRNLEITKLLAESLVYGKNQRLDLVRDQFFRTALHYAYGMEDGKPMVQLLLDYGMSEFSVDKDFRSPLVFKDRRGQRPMNRLLQYQLEQDFTTREPNPFAIPLPLPIIGYIKDWTDNSQHRQSRVALAMNADPNEPIDTGKIISVQSEGKVYEQVFPRPYVSQNSPVQKEAENEDAQSSGRHVSVISPGLHKGRNSFPRAFWNLSNRPSRVNMKRVRTFHGRPHNSVLNMQSEGGDFESDEEEYEVEYANNKQFPMCAIV
ncbi:hypothetical protein ScPMuIL_001366 [Solemya velum]